MTATTNDYIVVIDGRRIGQLWGHYSDRCIAEEAARKLRRIGMHGLVLDHRGTIVYPPRPTAGGRVDG